MIPSSTHRVPAQTDAAVNRRIWQRTQRNIAYFARRPDLIPARLRQLDREWDIERVLETLSSALSITGILWTLRRKRLWLILPLAVQAFFLQHAIQGWCPPLPFFRRLGVQTQAEIAHERHALRAIRLDRAEDLERHMAGV